MSDIQLGKPVGPTERYSLASRQIMLSYLYFGLALLAFFAEIVKILFGANPGNSLDFILGALLAYFGMKGYKTYNRAVANERKMRS